MIKRFVFRPQWIARRAGGLFLGVRVTFPTRVLIGPRWSFCDVVTLSIGFLVARLDVEFHYNAEPATIAIFHERVVP